MTIDTVKKLREALEDFQEDAALGFRIGDRVLAPLSIHSHWRTVWMEFYPEVKTKTASVVIDVVRPMELQEIGSTATNTRSMTFVDESGDSLAIVGEPLREDQLRELAGLLYREVNVQIIVTALPDPELQAQPEGAKP